MEINVNLEELMQRIDNLTQAVGNLAYALGVQATEKAAAKEHNQQDQVQQAQEADPTQQSEQPQQQQQSQQPQQTQQQAPVQQAVPTSTLEYSMDQLAVAATQLMDAGRQQDLVTLLGEFRVQALTGLPKEQYGAFATKLREMGAKI